jgi:chromosome segregation ATPase
MNEHYHDRSMWKKRERGQEVIREGLEQQYSDARQQNDENERKIVDLGEKIAELDREMEERLISLGRLTEDYAHLSLTGSFIGQVKTTIRFLETNLELINQKGEADPRLIERVKMGLNEMNQKLKVLQQLDPENDAENDGADGRTAEGTGGGSGGRKDGEGADGGSGSRWMIWRKGRWRVWRKNGQGNGRENRDN